jgi:hypothetical protein
MGAASAAPDTSAHLFIICSRSLNSQPATAGSVSAIALLTVVDLEVWQIQE